MYGSTGTSDIEEDFEGLKFSGPKLEGPGPLVVVDDDPMALRIAKAVFELNAIENPILYLRSGNALLEYMKEVDVGDADMPSMVLLDINMPSLDGHDTLRIMRAQNQFKSLPHVIMLTASNDAGDVAKAMQLGADGYQVKPFGLKDFGVFVRSLLP
jgi:CheY-like chemotaxis protein